MSIEPSEKDRTLPLSSCRVVRADAGDGWKTSNTVAVSAAKMVGEVLIVGIIMTNLHGKMAVSRR